MSDVVERQIILGAGASDGFPLGSELMDIIKKIGHDFSNNPGGFHPADKQRNATLKKVDSSFLNDLLGLIRDIENSCAVSIDFYTSRIRNKNRQKISEALVGAIINSFEFDRATTWYGHLLQIFFPESFDFQSSEKKLKSIKDKVKAVRIITFNYDLSLEKYLYSFLKNNIFYEEKDVKFLEEAKKAVFSRIEHVYGSIDERFKCELEDKKQFRLIKYDGIRSRQIIKQNNHNSTLEFNDAALRDACQNQEKYCQNIRLIEDKRSDEKLKLEVSKCDYLYILGFGFDPENIKRIGLNSSTWKKGCFVTNFGDNKKIKRIALSVLSNKKILSCRVPIISKLSVKEALEKDFSLSEQTLSEIIPLTANGSISPYFEMMKYEKLNNSQKTNPN